MEAAVVFRGGDGCSHPCNELHRQNCSAPAGARAAARGREGSWNTLGLSTAAGFARVRDGDAEMENPPGYTEKAAMKSHMLLCCSQAKHPIFVHPTPPSEGFTGLGYPQL